MLIAIELERPGPIGKGDIEPTIAIKIESRYAAGHGFGLVMLSRSCVIEPMRKGSRSGC